jgi:phospholipase/lecithinase/hemolysin
MRILISVLMLCVSMFTSAATLNKVVVFGDSLSDTGNLYEYMKHRFPMSPPYYKGRMTNGPVWVELLVQSFYPSNADSHLLDYAFAGAAVVEGDDEPLFTLHSEVESYLMAHQNKANAESLYVFWIGSNNYLAAPEDAEQAVQEVILGIKHSLQRLVDSGAKHVLILNLPNLGETPVARDMDAQSILTFFSNRHNQQLAQLVEELKVTYPSVQWIQFDIRSALDDLLIHPELNGFVNVTDSCYESSMDEESLKHGSVGLKVAATIKPTLQSTACDGYLFFDLVHPSGLAHKILARRVRDVLINSKIEFVN